MGIEDEIRRLEAQRIIEQQRLWEQSQATENALNAEKLVAQRVAEEAARAQAERNLLADLYRGHFQRGIVNPLMRKALAELNRTERGGWKILEVAGGISYTVGWEDGDGSYDSTPGSPIIEELRYSGLGLERHSHFIRDDGLFAVSDLIFAGYHGNFYVDLIKGYRKVGFLGGTKKLEIHQFSDQKVKIEVPGFHQIEPHQAVTDMSNPASELFLGLQQQTSDAIFSAVRRLPEYRIVGSSLP